MRKPNRRRPVAMSVDEKFFNDLERERKKEQEKLRLKLGRAFNLTHRNFTAMLAEKKFKFQFPKQRRKKK